MIILNIIFMIAAIVATIVYITQNKRDRSKLDKQSREIKGMAQTISRLEKLIDRKYWDAVKVSNNARHQLEENLIKTEEEIVEIRRYLGAELALKSKDELIALRDSQHIGYKTKQAIVKRLGEITERVEK